jgi:glycosyltransferase involved in cell wall biosynthesis
LNVGVALEAVRRGLLEGDYDAIRPRLVELLVQEPRLGQGWVFLGELLERTGEKYAAWKAFQRAWLLDPMANWVTEARRRLGTAEVVALEPWLTDLLAVESVSIAAAMIVKDEASNVARWYESLRDAVDELVVVDTGSSDGTVEVLRKLGVDVLKFGWTNSFAEARNFALTHVKSQWVLWVDADEWLEPEDVEVPRVAAGLFHSLGVPLTLRIQQVNDLGGHIEVNGDMSRMHPVGFGFHWEGRIHEQLAPGAGFVEGDGRIPRVAINLRLNHTGYHPTVMEQKAKLTRNIALLREAVSDDPSDLAAWGFLGRELLFAGEIDGAIDALYRAEFLARDAEWYGRRAEVRGFLIEALLRQERVEEARAAASRGVMDNPEFPGIWFLKGRVELLAATKLMASAKDAFEKAQTTAATYRGIVSFDALIPKWRARAGLADLARFSGDLVAARRMYEGILKIEPGLSAVEAQIERIDQQARVLASLLGEDSAKPTDPAG